MKQKLKTTFYSLFLIGIFSLLSNYILAQNDYEITLNWGDEPGEMYNSFTEESTLYPNLENSFVSTDQFLFIKIFPRNSLSKHWGFTVLSYQTASISTIEKIFLDERIEIEDTLQLTVKNNSKAGNPVAVLSFTPFIKVDGVIKKITSIKLKRTIETVYQAKSTTFASSSVLKEGSGDWYKIAVKRDGVYRIDYDYLTTIGVNTKQLKTSSINIYGNAFGRLPELNSSYRPDDLLKNAIYVNDGGDGYFDKGDYILFYGKGPHKWEEFNGAFERNLNIYSNHSAYFININLNATPLRISDAATVTQPSTNNVTDYNSFTIHEIESHNLMKTGQRWYGEKFDVQLTRNFAMHIPNLIPGAPAQIKGYMASGIGNANYVVSYGGTQLGKVSFSGSGSNNYSRKGFVSNAGIFQPSSSSFQITVKFNRSSPATIGYLDYLAVNTRSYLSYNNGLQFRDLNSVGAGNISEFTISHFPSNGIVWDITEPTQPMKIQGNYSNGTYTYKANTDSLRTFITFAGNTFQSPSFIEKVNHQNLHSLSQADYLIVTHPRFLTQANRLAKLHEGNGLTVHVVTTEQVYNEFSGGTQDPTAIKFFAKMFYDRAAGDTSKQPHYLLLFGDATYDPLNRVPNNNYLVPSYETLNSEQYASTLVSDDYFGFLDDSESFTSSDLLDIAVGRLIATTKQDAVNLVNKIELYMKNGSSLYSASDVSSDDNGYVSAFGDWRLRYTLIGDDEQDDYFITNDLESAASHISSNFPVMNVKKIYSDAYQQITTAGGERYPDVNKDIEKSLEAGALVTCYVGHGGAKGAAQERIMTPKMMQELTNIDKLTLFVSATCEFARIDDNELVSIGEIMALNKIGGAIAMMTTSRAVYLTTNSIVTDKFFKNVFVRHPDGTPRTFGEIIMKTKNEVVGGSNNKRSFLLLGDPALRIALPYHKVVLDSINDVAVNVETDTLKALSKVTMKGHIEDQFGNVLSNFDGIIEPTIFDKPKDKTTLGNDQGSSQIPYKEQTNKLFKGKATVKNGRFEFEFIVPKDIDYSYGKGKASFYASNEPNTDAGGHSYEFFIGGVDTSGLDDDLGPEITLYLNDESFVNGSLTDETPILIAKLYDESGINTVGNGIGHDITMILDDNTSEAVVLNDFYESDLDTYKSGQLNYQLNKLKEGRHTLTFKAWDVNNNSSEETIEFIVHKKEEMALDHVLNYPNPFTTSTEFFFEHNQVNVPLEVQIQIYTVAGRLVKTINKLVQTNGFRSQGIPWNGRDDFSDRLAQGVYVYRITVESPTGEKASEIQKLYLLK